MAQLYATTGSDSIIVHVLDVQKYEGIDSGVYVISSMVNLILSKAKDAKRRIKKISESIFQPACQNNLMKGIEKLKFSIFPVKNIINKSENPKQHQIDLLPCCNMPVHFDQHKVTNEEFHNCRYMV